MELRRLYSGCNIQVTCCVSFSTSLFSITGTTSGNAMKETAHVCSTNCSVVLLKRLGSGSSRATSAAVTFSESKSCKSVKLLHYFKNTEFIFDNVSEAQLQIRRENSQPDVSHVKSGLVLKLKVVFLLFLCTGCCLLYSSTYGLYTVDIFQKALNQFGSHPHQLLSCTQGNFIKL